MTSENTQNPLKVAVVGIGAGVFSMHRRSIERDEIELVAGVDVVAENGRPRAEEYGVPFFSDHRAMLAEIKPELTAIIVPHPFHAQIAVDALNAGSHVLVEKPIAVHVGEADEMIDAARDNNRVLGVNFQHRQRSDVQALKRMIDSGELGQIQRVTMVEPWLRTAAYFRNAGWRGTWRGEGGGTLMNQGPHGLDLLCYLVGAPAQVVAWTRTRRHAIETEDTATAMLEWSDGALGTLHFSTTEGGPRSMEIAGTRGIIRLSQAGNAYWRFETDLFEHIESNPNPFASPNLEPAELPDEEDEMVGHVAVYLDMMRAIREQGKPLCSGEDARHSLELSNAMIASSRLNRAIELPLDRDLYTSLLQDLIEQAEQTKAHS